jgi:diacylglycerol kinase
VVGRDRSLRATGGNPDPALRARLAAVGASLYIGVSLVVEAVIGYGGCEIAGIPTLMLQQRYTIYCLLNSADLAERAMRHRSRWVAGVLGVVTFVLTIGAYEWVTLTISHRAVVLSSWIIYLVFLLAGLSHKQSARSQVRAASGAAFVTPARLPAIRQVA